ncbi:delta-type opioid receptor-like [Liolophura sinensis]|uniref:delta-type opioid receptor-like n=1 Tax=Liolophura sinensis TaxID=3198878 RepID=UPI003158DC7E
MTTDAPLTTENFILIDISEIGRLLRSLKLRPIGRFENKPVFVDRNNTRYLVVMKPMEKQIQELHEKLANNTDNGLVCVTGICMDTDSAKSYMDKLAAKVAISVSPSELLPFSLMVTTFIAVAVLGIIGNVLIITGVGCRKTLRNSTSVFLCGLAVFDIFVLALGLPLQVVKVFFAVQSINADVCRAYEFMRHFSIITSTLTMTVMSIERYIAICHPLKAKSYCTVKNARNCTAGIWVVCIGCCIPLVVADYTGKGGCGAPYRDLSMLIVYHVAVSIAVFGLPLMVMLPLYLRIFIVLWLSSQKAEEMKRQANVSHITTFLNVCRQVKASHITTFLYVTGRPSQSDATNPMNSDSSVNMRKQTISEVCAESVSVLTTSAKGKQDGEVTW